ncbi:MAG: hypothetical protein K2O66_07985, partial [Bacteroidales bacterium]|nr:hypothetical protein [Bacteroidales bacterium]
AVTNEGLLTVALDIALDEQLIEEGLARELVNRIQNLRKEKGLDVTDKIAVSVQRHPAVAPAIEHNLPYICSETLAKELTLCDSPLSEASPVELTDDITLGVHIEKI